MKVANPNESFELALLIKNRNVEGLMTVTKPGASMSINIDVKVSKKCRKQFNKKYISKGKIQNMKSAEVFISVRVVDNKVTIEGAIELNHNDVVSLRTEFDMKLDLSIHKDMKTYKAFKRDVGQAIAKLKR